MAREGVEVPVSAIVNLEQTNRRGGSLMCRVCIICFSLVPNEFIQQHMIQLHDTNMPEDTSG